MDPCSLAVRPQSASGAPFGPSVGLAEAYFVSLDVFCYSGGAIVGFLVPICCPRAPFSESVYHLFARFRGQFDVHQFFYASGSNKEPKGFQSGNIKSVMSPSESVLQICYEKCAPSSQLMPHEARHLRLVYNIYIYIYAIYIYIYTRLTLWPQATGDFE